MLVALCTWIVSCIIDQMRFFSDAWQALLFWAALLFPVLIFEYRFFSWVLVSCDCASTFLFRATVLPVSCCTCSPRCRVRDIQYRFRWNRQWSSASLLFFASRSELLVASDLLGFRLLRSIGTSTEYRRSTAAVVPSYLVSKLGAALVQFAQWRSIRNRLDTRSCC